jgi:O-antigen/teichoic acid export membrane protein
MTPYHDLIVLTIGRACQLLAGFLSIKIATTLLSPDQLGSMNQTMSLAILGTSALFVPIAGYIGRGCLEWRDAGVLRPHLFTYLRSVLTVGLLLGIAAWALQSGTLLVSGMAPLWVGGLVTLYTIGYSLHIMGSTGLNLIGHRSLYVLFGNVAAWGGLLLALYFSQIRMAPETWLLGIFLGFLLSSCSYILLMRYGDERSLAQPGKGHALLPFDRHIMLMFVWPQAVVFGLSWVQSQSYRFILTSVADIGNVGLFAAGYMVCSVPMQTFESLFNEFYSPRWFRALKGQDAGGLAQAWNAYAGAYVPAVILFGAFLVGNAGFLVKVLLGEQFQSIAAILVLPALTEMLRALSSSLHHLGLAKVDMTVNILPGVVGALVAPTFVYALAPYDPLVGTAVALFAAGIAVFAIIIPMSYRALPIVWPIRRIVLAAAFGIPLALMGRLMALGFGEVTDAKAAIALACSGFVMIVMQYLMSKEWFHEVSPIARSTV